MAGYLGCARYAIAGKVTPVFTTESQRDLWTLRLTNPNKEPSFSLLCDSVVKTTCRGYNRRSMWGYLASGICGAFAASAAGYQSMAPTGQLFGRTFTGLRPGTKHLALTYDDGPNDPHTFRLLEVLARHNVKATFFLIGRFVKQRPDIVRELVQAGHVVGNHTFSHPNLVFASAEQTESQLRDCEQALTDAVGQHSRLFRPPFGGRRPGTLRIVRTLGLEPVMWSVTGWDWKGKPAEYVEQKVGEQVCGGSVILLHDGSHVAFGADRSQSVIATDRLIARYKSEGYEFVTVPAMIEKSVVSSQSAVLS
jgi:peptidoglycan-N-acetylglucosamine deacetylase